MFVVHPQIRRDVVRALDVISVVPEEPADYSITQNTVEIPLWQAVHIEDETTTCKRAQPGEILHLHPKVIASVQNRIVMAEVHPALYEYGRPTFKRIYSHGHDIVLPVTWECYHPYDIAKLPFLFELYIVNQLIRGPGR